MQVAIISLYHAFHPEGVQCDVFSQVIKGGTKKMLEGTERLLVVAYHAEHYALFDVQLEKRR
jgi:hypothetical protein